MKYVSEKHRKCNIFRTSESSPSALLKPLTPIAGTNLFLNIPYKMLDHTRPGCYAVWFSERYRDFSGSHKGLSIVCNKNDQKWYKTPDSSWIFERTTGPESLNEYKGTVKIKNVGTGNTLESWKSSNVWWVGLGSYAGKPDEDMWMIRSDPKNKNHVQLELQQWFLHQTPYAGHRAYISLAHNKPAGYPYSFVAAIDLQARLYDFKFTKPTSKQLAEHTSQKGFMDSQEILNDSPATIYRTITVSEKITNEFSWGLSQSYEAMTKITGKANIPLIASTTVEVGLTFSLGANQNWKSTNEKLFQMSYQVNVPPHSSVKVSAWYDLIKGISIPYTAESEITGKTTRITTFDDIIDDSPATGKMIHNYLQYTHFEGTLVKINEFSVIMRTKGTMLASYGVNGQIGVDGKSVTKQATPK